MSKPAGLILASQIALPILTPIPIMKDFEVIHSKEDSQFKIHIGRHSAHLDYSPEDKDIVIHHTFVPPELRGRGLAAELAEAALRYAEDAGLTVVSHCSYIDRYMERRT